MALCRRLQSCSERHAFLVVVSFVKDCKTHYVYFCLLFLSHTRFVHLSALRHLLSDSLDVTLQ